MGNREGFSKNERIMGFELELPNPSGIDESIINAVYKTLQQYEKKFVERIKYGHIQE